MSNLSNNSAKIKNRIKTLVTFFMSALILSGLTAFPIKFGITVLNDLFGTGSFMNPLWPHMSEWISNVKEGVYKTYNSYPFIGYGTDWLAFAHIIFAISFTGVLKDPVRNIWVVEFSMIACILIIPLALICGPIRGIPFFWQIIDCCFGVFGIIPLWILRKDILQLTAES